MNVDVTRVKVGKDGKLYVTLSHPKTTGKALMQFPAEEATLVFKEAKKTLRKDISDGKTGSD